MPSVHLSVCLSHAGIVAKDYAVLIFGIVRFIWKFSDRITASEVIKSWWGMEKFGQALSFNSSRHMAAPTRKQ